MYDLGLLVTDSPIKTARKAEQCAVCGTEKETAGASAGSRECVISPPEKRRRRRHVLATFWETCWLSCNLNVPCVVVV